MKLASRSSVVLGGVIGVLLGGFSPPCHGGGTATPGRATRGLLAIYDFADNKSSVVKDRSGVSPPLDLTIADPKAVHRLAGSLEVVGKTILQSSGPATRLSDAIQRSAALTIEVWVAPARIDQSGPARIVTFSKNTSERNFTLGQEASKFDVRLRTTKTNNNGMPGLASPAGRVKLEPSHLVYTRDARGRARIYINGKQVAEKSVAGDLGKFSNSFRLALGNEFSGDRPWQGTYYLVALYDRDLSAGEVERNFSAGSHIKVPAASGTSLDARFFTSRVAPLLANHCLECHDAATKKGGLVLSRKALALAGGDSGPAITPGKSSESLLWTYVESNDMPADRMPLSDEEKQALRQWIDAGAAWPVDPIDPAHYAHGQSVDALWLQRLTVSEYIETVRSAVGIDIAEEARRILPADLRADGFSNTAYNLNVDLKHVDAYEQLAQLIVERMDMRAFAGRFSKQHKLTDDAMRDLIARMGKWVLRGPLEEREVVLYRGISTSVASAGGDFDEAVGYVLQAMLQSPRFVYRIERQRGDGRRVPVGPYELASRMSYIVWGGPPDAELMRAADDGALHKAGQARKQLERMLKDPRAVERSCDFVAQWLNLGRLEHLQPSPQRFPQWSPELATDMRAETLAFFRHIAWEQRRPLSDLLNAQVTFITPRLARHYGLPPQGDGLSRYDLSAVASRGGLLTQGSILTVGGDEASMVTRGLFVLHDLLRGVVKDPPPCVDTTPQPTKPGLTQRGMALRRIADKSCGGCHARFEPLAFGLERFDGLGGYHKQDEHGNGLRDDGEVLIPGDAAAKRYESSAELMNLLADSERVAETITWKVTQFALGRPLVAEDVPTLQAIHKTAKQKGGDYASLITAIVMSDLVQTTRMEPRQ